MKVKIESVSKEHDNIRISFNTSWCGDMVISQEEYAELGKPTVYDDVEVVILVGSKES